MFFLSLSPLVPLLWLLFLYLTVVKRFLSFLLFPFDRPIFLSLSCCSLSPHISRPTVFNSLHCRIKISTIGKTPKRPIAWNVTVILELICRVRHAVTFAIFQYLRPTLFISLSCVRSSTNSSIYELSINKVNSISISNCWHTLFEIIIILSGRKKLY